MDEATKLQFDLSGSLEFTPEREWIPDKLGIGAPEGELLGGKVVGWIAGS